MDKISFWRLILLKIYWNPWNPWCVGRMNLAWRKYMETPMYEGRKELEKAHPDHFTDYTRRAFVDNHEIKHFMSNFTKKDKIKLFFAPFSFGSTFRMPFWKVENRIFGFFDKI
jgi:hypothetical protein